VIVGASALHSRLNALLHVAENVERTWAAGTVPIIAGYIPENTGATRGSLRATTRGIVGSPIVDFLDRGTRAHEEVARNAKVLRFQVGGRTLFRKRVSKPQTRGQDFKDDAMRRGLDRVGDGAIIATWNGAA